MNPEKPCKDCGKLKLWSGMNWFHRHSGSEMCDEDPTPNEPDLRGRDRDEWRHEAVEQQRLK